MTHRSERCPELECLHCSDDDLARHVIETVIVIFCQCNHVTCYMMRCEDVLLFNCKLHHAVQNFFHNIKFSLRDYDYCHQTKKEREL